MSPRIGVTKSFLVQLMASSTNCGIYISFLYIPSLNLLPNIGKTKNWTEFSLMLLDWLVNFEREACQLQVFVSLATLLVGWGSLSNTPWSVESPVTDYAFSGERFLWALRPQVSQDFTGYSRMNTPKIKRRVGKYEVGRTIGEGTFAKVKFARNSESGESVALKILDKDKVLKHNMAVQVVIHLSICFSSWLYIMKTCI